jgi:biopolymer transport protein ExbB/TolQ
MPWWSWLIIWAVLVLALLAMLALFGWQLFRKVVAVFGSLEALASTTELLESAGEALEEQRGTLALLQKHSEVALRRHRVREEAAARRQARHDARIDRARRITRVDANTRRWFEDN